ncbi:unnamed protein product, partial [marine sediment metagenome]
VVARQEKIGNKHFTKLYHVYSPTRISSIKGLYGATESRAITQIHTKAPKTDARGELDPENDREKGDWAYIRNGCYLFMLQNWKRIKQEYDNFNENVDIKQRDMQLWKPLLVLAKIIDKDLFERVKKFAEKISTQRTEDYLPEGTFDYDLLEIMANLIKEGQNKIFVEDIKQVYKANNPEQKIHRGFNRSASVRISNMGFDVYRKKDHHKGAYFEMTQDLFDNSAILLNPSLIIGSSQVMCKRDEGTEGTRANQKGEIEKQEKIIDIKTDNKSSQSSQSSQYTINNNNIRDEEGTKGTNKDNPPHRTTIKEQEKVKVEDIEPEEIEEAIETEKIEDLSEVSSEKGDLHDEP